MPLARCPACNLPFAMVGRAHRCIPRPAPVAESVSLPATEQVDGEVRQRVEIDRLRELISYNPETGTLTWKQDCGRARVGQDAGKVSRQGYRSVQIDGVFYQGHVLAWAIMTGAWPSALIDHRDRDAQNNAWDNLREASFAENARNASLHKDSSSGFRGVSWHSQKGKWRAEIKADGESHFLGLFDDASEAALAYDRAAIKLHGEFASLNFPATTVHMEGNPTVAPAIGVNQSAMGVTPPSTGVDAHLHDTANRGTPAVFHGVDIARTGDVSVTTLMERKPDGTLNVISIATDRKPPKRDRAKYMRDYRSRVKKRSTAGIA